MRIFFVSILAFVFTCFGFYYFRLSDDFEVCFLNVGQGDASLIKIPSGLKILIDGGPDNSILRPLGKQLSFFQRTIDFIIISHAHDDHVFGLVEILKRYRVRKIFFSAPVASASLMILIKEIAIQKNISLEIVDQPLKINFSSVCFLDLIPVEIFNIKDDPNNSLIAKLDCQGRKILFTGDSSTKVEQALADSGLEIDVDVFKAAHHGSNSANSEDFLRLLSPQAVVISSGAGNRFGHPHPAVLQRLQDLNIFVYRIDEVGTVLIK